MNKMKNKTSYSQRFSLQPRSPASQKHSQHDKETFLRQSFSQSNPFMNKKIKLQVLQITKQQMQKQMNSVPMTLTNLKNIFKFKQFKQEKQQAENYQSETTKAKRNQCIPIYRKIQSRKKQSIKQSIQKWEQAEQLEKRRMQIMHENYQPFDQRQSILNQIKSTILRGQKINDCYSSSNFKAFTQRKTLNTAAKRVRQPKQAYFQRKKSVQNSPKQLDNYFSLKQGQDLGIFRLRVAGNKAPCSQTGNPWKRSFSTTSLGSRMQIKFVK